MLTKFSRNYSKWFLYYAHEEKHCLYYLLKATLEFMPGLQIKDVFLSCIKPFLKY